MKLKRAVCVLLCTLLLWTQGAFRVFADASLSSYSRVDKHWVYDELAELKHRIGGILGPGSQYGAISEADKQIIRTYILNEEQLDQPIKAEHWAIWLDALLVLPMDEREQLLKMYVFGLATGDEITREDAVG